MSIHDHCYETHGAFPSLTLLHSGLMRRASQSQEKVRHYDFIFRK